MTLRVEIQLSELEAQLLENAAAEQSKLLINLALKQPPGSLERKHNQDLAMRYERLAERLKEAEPKDEKRDRDDWCHDHNVPMSNCSSCNPR